MLKADPVVLNGLIEKVGFHVRIIIIFFHMPLLTLSLVTQYENVY